MMPTLARHAVGILICPNYSKNSDSLNSCCNQGSKTASSRGQLRTGLCLENITEREQNSTEIIND